MTTFIVISIVALVVILYYLAFQVYLLKLENKSQNKINQGLIDLFENLKNNFITFTESSTELASKVTKNINTQEEINKHFVALENAFKHFLIEEFKKNEKFPIKKRDIVYVGDSKRYVLDVEYIVKDNWEVEVILRTLPLYVSGMSLNEIYTTAMQWLKKDQVSKTKPKKSKK